jgi:hypothetical protein
MKILETMTIEYLLTIVFDEDNEYSWSSKSDAREAIIRRFNTTRQLLPVDLPQREKIDTVPFEKPEVESYLHRCILHWRVKDAEGDKFAKYYIDAFQSVSMSLFGEIVPENTTLKYCKPVNGVHALWCPDDKSAS